MGVTHSNGMSKIHFRGKKKKDFELGDRYNRKDEHCKTLLNS